MRPRRLELQGFTAFRDAVTVDFEDVDLFALVGPTGAGKTSLIDALCFALYGTVPRLDRRAVAPVISAGLLEARVRYDFTVGDDDYTAVRVVRRTKSGATTKEARLERGAEVLAGDADAVTRTVESLLGLGFEQFSKCVVLPQGEFARFLHDKPADRQDLLVRLLELGLYERMRDAANARRKVAEDHAVLLRGELERLPDASEGSLAQADRRITDLTALRDLLEQGEERLSAVAREAERALAERQDAEARTAALAAVAVPPDIAARSEAADAAAARLRAAQEAMEAAAAGTRAAEAQQESLPSATQLERVLKDHATCSSLEERTATGVRMVEEARSSATTARAAVTRAAAEVAAAEQALEQARHEHAAAALAATLSAGAACPVCEQPVPAVPARSTPTPLAEAEQRLADVRHRHTVAQQQADDAGKQVARYEETLSGLREQLAELRPALEGQPAPPEALELLEAFRAAQAATAQAREREDAARTELQDAMQGVDAVREDERAAWQQFDRVRDAVAALGPPSVDRGRLAASWSALAAWAGERLPGEQDAAAKAAAQLADLRAEEERLRAELRRRCADAGVELGKGSPRAACADALAQAKLAHERIADSLARAADLRDRVARHAEEAAVAGQLHRHLAADGFERWLLEEALQRLADGATGVLGELTGGQYSLDLDDHRGFVVIDHRNADERRSARTLSGGETFLASLALALALAEQVTDMAVAATPRLESIFLDEGFGTLDPETLDVVAAAIEELGARGRTVGLVTHVRDLADRLPVRYEVRRGVAGSTVERVVA